MFHLIFRTAPVVFTLTVIFLFGIGVVRFEGHNRYLRALNSWQGWVYQVIPEDVDNQATAWLDRVAGWLGSPLASEDGASSRS